MKSLLRAAEASQISQDSIQPDLWLKDLDRVLTEIEKMARTGKNSIETRMLGKTLYKLRELGYGIDVYTFGSEGTIYEVFWPKLP